MKSWSTPLRHRRIRFAVLAESPFPNNILEQLESQGLPKQNPRSEGEMRIDARCLRGENCLRGRMTRIQSQSVNRDRVVASINCRNRLCIGSIPVSCRRRVTVPPSYRSTKWGKARYLLERRCESSGNSSASTTSACSMPRPGPYFCTPVRSISSAFIRSALLAPRTKSSLKIRLEKSR